MPSQKNTKSSRVIVQDYINYRLNAGGQVRYVGSSQNTEDLGPEEKAMRSLGDKVVERFHRADISTLLGRVPVTRDNAYLTFRTAADELFEDGHTSWGRIVILVAFAGHLALYYRARGLENIENDVLDWASVYINTHLAVWIYQHGGWRGLAETTQRRDRDNKQKIFKLVMCGFVGGVLGAALIQGILFCKSW
ncbi:apoptosis regulator Bcl-2 [Elysia marginata]|uniref:Apoptosis regulator Bcl-2 n=1 Tax=Elysia marginata TaxID=1093978 RepID=A0AAV4GVW2_9GAST|nr:apoptosis regulator Bcl-2 [Elysia marginata]